MRQKKKVDKAVAGLMAFLESKGVATENVKVDESLTDNNWHRSLEAEGILISLDSDRLQFTARACKQCEEVFATNYKAVAYCSDACRKRALEKLGITWDPTKTAQQRWGWNEYMPNQLPTIIGQKAIQVLEKLFEQIQELQSQKEMAQAEEARRIRIANETPEETQKRVGLEAALQSAYGPEFQQQLRREFPRTLEFSGVSSFATLPGARPLTSGLPQGNSSENTNPPELLPSDSEELLPAEFPEF